MTDDPLKLLSLREAASLLGIEPAAVRRLVDEGHVGAYVKENGGALIPRRSLEVWVERIAQGGYVQLAWLPPEQRPKKRKKRDGPRTTLAPSVRFAVLRRCGFKCAYCGRTAASTSLQIDHVVALAKGGTDDPDNLVAACFECNSGKSDTALNPSEVLVWTRN